MKKNLIRCGLFALALTVGLSAAPAPAPAQELSSLYVTPKILYSKQTGDMSKAHWTRTDNGTPWSSGVLGGSKKDDSFGFGLAFGNDFSYSSSYPIRAEIEYIYHGEGEFGKGPSAVNINGDNYRASQNFKIKAHTLMVNGFYDINLDSALTPYIGGGVGMAYLKSSYKSSLRENGDNPNRVAMSNNDWSFAWNIGGGVTYALDNQMALDFGYRYFDMGSAEPGSNSQNFNNNLSYRGSPKVDLTAHEFSVGLRFSGF